MKIHCHQCSTMILISYYMISMYYREKYLIFVGTWKVTKFVWTYTLMHVIKYVWDMGFWYVWSYSNGACNKLSVIIRVHLSGLGHLQNLLC